MQVENKTPKFMDVEEEAKVNNLEYFEVDWGSLGPFLKEIYFQERRGILKRFHKNLRFIIFTIFMETERYLASNCKKKNLFVKNTKKLKFFLLIRYDFLMSS